MELTKQDGGSILVNALAARDDVGGAPEALLGPGRQAVVSCAARQPPSSVRPSPILTVVVPTFNESANVPLLVERVASALEGVDWELVFVDDNSPDATSAIAKDLGRRDARVRCIRRVGRRGLSGACLEGALSSQAEFVAIMDADLQHDERLLPRMLDALRRGKPDLVIGSRYTNGGAANGFSLLRGSISRTATQWARRLTGVAVHDPMSGFFMMRRELLDQIAPELSSEGFKILFDILTTVRRRKLSIVELPYGFRARLNGKSKFDVRIGLEFVSLILAKLTHQLVSPRFFSFLAVGGSGVLVQLLCLSEGLATGLPFWGAQSLATLAAMTSNFLLNNVLTYSDQRVTGWRMLPALFGFYAVCSIGALSNVGVSSWLFSKDPVWWLAGIAGSIVGAVWNYAGSSTLVWNRP